ncbi:MAG: response regulator [Calditrichia bacterium]
MRLQSNIVQYLENIIQSIKKMEKNSEVFSELKHISQELELLEQYVRTTLETLDSNFNSFVKQISLLSELIEFQRGVLSFKNSDKMVQTLFEFLLQNVRYNHGFIGFKLREEDKEYTVISNRNEHIELYQDFVHSPEMKILESVVQKRDLAYLITDVRQFSGEKANWDKLKAKSLILFPIKIRGNFLGIGLLVRQDETFELNDLSFVNLVVGIISLLIYQHFYFARLKSRLFRQFQLRKMLEEVKYAEYFEKGPLYIFTLDPRYVILHANSAAISGMKIEEELIIGDNFLEVIPKAYQLGFRRVLDEASDKEVRYFQSPIAPKNGYNPILNFYVSRIQLQNRFSLILVFAIDVTKSYFKNIIEHRNEMLDEIDQFSRTLIGQFNNLLTIVVPNISLLRTRLAGDHPYQKQLEVIERATQRSTNLIQKFLNYNLEEFESPEKGDLNKFIKSFIDSMSKEIPRNIDVKLQLDESLKEIGFYPLRMRKLIKIILDNSIIALNNKQGAEISVSTRLLHQTQDGLVDSKPFFIKSGDYLELCIADNGCGIPENSIHQVFKPFYSTRIKNEGVGLGLFIAYNIVKDMQGQIHIESKFEEFTKVFAYLPVKEETSMEVRELENETISKEVKKIRPTILVVDDEYNIRSMMREIMEMSGFKVYTAGNGRDGVDVYQRHQAEIDLVILDMVMPVMDGRAAFEEIKKIKKDQKIYIISGYSQREDLEDMLKKGAVGFMRKPFQVKEIVSKIKEILKIDE